MFVKMIYLAKLRLLKQQNAFKNKSDPTKYHENLNIAIACNEQKEVCMNILDHIVTKREI